jgi:hypothetical protein
MRSGSLASRRMPVLVSAVLEMTGGIGARDRMLQSSVVVVTAVDVLQRVRRARVAPVAGIGNAAIKKIAHESKPRKVEQPQKGKERCFALRWGYFQAAHFEESEKGKHPTFCPPHGSSEEKGSR